VHFAPSRVTPDELNRLIAAVCASVPVTKIRLTGGEPTLCPTLAQHIRTAAWLVPTVGLTTNGVVLERLLPELRDAGLNRLNISLDAADAEGFHRATRHDRFAAVMASVRAAKRLGFAPLKINAVATVDTDPAALARLAIAEGVHLRFIELMDIGVAHADWCSRHIPAISLREWIEQSGLAITESPDRNEPTSRVWTVDGVDPAATTLGFITTVTSPFCATCDRIRLTSQGRLHTCLFDERGVDLLPLLRADDFVGLDAAIRRAIGAKAPPLRFQRSGMMAGIGG
jgi:cyclic pyranopterin phosphate synthase